MADLKISQLTGATTPLAGTEVLPVVQSGVTKQVSVANLTAGRAVGALSLSVTQGITGGSGFQVSGFTSYRASGASASSPGDASMYYNAATGQTFQARAGSSYDWSLINPGNASYILRVPTGTLNMEMADGNLAFSTAAKGVNFTANTPAAGMTSQLLNWYEEGTWTPTLIGGTSNPTVTYGLQRAKYTRIGRLVTVDCYMSWTALTGGSGQLRLDGLPFTVSNAVPNTSSAGALMNMNGITLAAGRTFAAMQAVGGTTYCVIRNLGSAVNGTTTDIVSVAASGELGFTISYVAA